MLACDAHLDSVLFLKLCYGCIYIISLLLAFALLALIASHLATRGYLPQSFSNAVLITGEHVFLNLTDAAPSADESTRWQMRCDFRSLSVQGD